MYWLARAYSRHVGPDCAPQLPILRGELSFLLPAWAVVINKTSWKYLSLFLCLLSQNGTHIVAAHTPSDRTMASATWLALLVTERHVWLLRCQVCECVENATKSLAARPCRRKQLVSSHSRLTSPAKRNRSLGPTLPLG